ncbi:hypothetical protein BLOT_011747 [Blomia tropicalis]|nr:hypothetical protein BLOT_011747 [Blomia tropicalis]
MTDKLTQSIPKLLSFSKVAVKKSFEEIFRKLLHYITNTNITKNSESVLSSNQSPDLDAYILKIGRPFNSNENPDVSSSNNIVECSKDLQPFSHRI